jgi:hypothetical protein
MKRLTGPGAQDYNTLSQQNAPEAALYGFFCSERKFTRTPQAVGRHGFSRWSLGRRTAWFERHFSTGEPGSAFR